MQAIGNRFDCWLEPPGNLTKEFSYIKKQGRYKTVVTGRVLGSQGGERRGLRGEELLMECTVSISTVEQH